MPRESFGRSCLLAIAVFVAVCMPQTKTPASTPGEVFRDCSDCPEVVAIPPGSIQMGSDGTELDGESNERPRHLVTIPAPLGVGRYEVTIEEFGRFVEATGYRASSVCYADPDGDGQYEDLAASGYGWSKPGFPRYEQGAREPVTCVTWHDAQAYVAWLSKRTGKKYRLLTEAEWEYAVRAGSTTPFHWGTERASGCAYGNGADKNVLALKWWPSKWPVWPCDDAHLYTSPVGSYKPNQFGLFDMVGNVSEWVQDCYVEDYDDAPSDGSAVDGACVYRVVRGGNWGNSPNRERSASRDWEKPAMTGHSFGFRVAREI